MITNEIIVKALKGAEEVGALEIKDITNSVYHLTIPIAFALRLQMDNEIERRTEQAIKDYKATKDQELLVKARDEGWKECKQYIKTLLDE